jgi:hypothetical protein
MRPAEDINQLIKKLNLKASANLDKRIRERISGAQAELNNKPSAQIQPNIWRIIMKNPISKIAAAAVIIILVLIINSQFSSSNVLWADVVEQMNNHTRYKCRQRVVREQGPEYPTMQVYHLNLQQRRQELEDGTIHIIDMRDKDPITVELYPKEKKAIVTTLVGFGSRMDPDIIDMVKRFDQESTERLGTKKKNGRLLYGFRHMPNKYNDFTVWVDSETKLPVEIELKHPTAGQTIFMDEFEFDFDLDPSAFSTKVPDGYQVETVTRNYGTVEYEEVTDEDIRNDLNKTAYTIERFSRIVNMHTIKANDPLGTGAKVFMIGINTNDGNTIIIAQGELYDMKRMIWIPDQQLVLETPRGAKLYTHPNGGLYAQYFLESMADENPEFFDTKNLSDERFTRMIVMPDETVLSLSANKQMSDEQIQELVESLVEIK